MILIKILKHTSLKKVVLILGFSFLIVGCLVEPRCFNDADCPSGHYCEIHPSKKGTCQKRCSRDSECESMHVCNMSTGRCEAVECIQTADCQAGYECEKGRCKAVLALTCPVEMAVIDNSFCMDKYEASKKDASGISSGTDESVAVSKKGVIPWQVDSNEKAHAACVAAQKELCTSSQWYLACSNVDTQQYSYGDGYVANTCNGIDAFCFCEKGSDPCPFPHCYGELGATFQLVPTGSFDTCKNKFGVFDLNGNLWEHVKDGDDYTVRGGAFNCLDSETLHQCSYIPSTWVPSARGFRCCSKGTLEEAFNKEQL